MIPTARPGAQGDFDFAGTGKGGESRLDREFKEFHTSNPAVYESLARMSRAWKAKGFDQVGMKMLWEVLRYHHGLQTRGDPAFKLNNNHPSRYARLIMEREADLAGFFEIRELKS